MENKSFIYIKTQKEGFHKWDKAPVQVSFLRNTHRHIFYFKVFIQLLKHNDREIEFFMFKKEVDIILQTIWMIHNLDIYECDGMSCEMISDELYEHLHKIYPDREIKIEISEDNENGSYKEY
jgi:hypothetical protein